MHKLFGPSSVPGLPLPAEPLTGETELASAAQRTINLPVWQLLTLAALLLCLLVLVVCLAVRSRRAKKAPDSVTAIEIGKLHEQGRREEQQDSFGVSDETLAKSHGILIAVADGMGGLENGGKVSAAVVESVLDRFMTCAGEPDAKALLLTLGREAVAAVNALLGQEGCRKSGSTLSLGYIRDDRFSFLNIGDSRICLLRDGALLQLNREHTYENELALRAINGELTVNDALSDPKGAGLVNFIGMGELMQFDMPAAPLRLRAKDKLILMSDGVYNALSEDEMLAALSAPCHEAVNNLRAAIEGKQYTNQDNFTAVVVACEGKE